MNSTRANQRRVPVRKRVMMLTLLTILGSLFIASVTGILCIRWIKNSSEVALTEQLETNLKSIVQQKAVSADAKLEHYEKYIAFMRDYIEEMYRDEAKMIAAGHIFDVPRDTHEYALTRGFATGDMRAEDFREELLFFSNLEPVVKPIALENENLITTIYAGTKTGLLTSYDRWSYLSAVGEGEEMVYDFFKSDWYRKGIAADGVFYTSLYVDSQGRGLTITVASPFRDKSGDVAGVICADYDITGLHSELLSLDLGEGSFCFALDAEGRIIAPDAEEQAMESYTGLSDEEMEALLNDSDGILEKDGSVYVCVPIERVGWTLCACVPGTVIQSGIQDADLHVRQASFVFVFIAATIILFSIFAVNRVARSITYPMELLGRDIEIIAGGDLSYRASVYRNDEIGDITLRVNEMVDRLNATMNDLVNSQAEANAMSRLATRDSLTGIRNKRAYDERVRILKQDLTMGNREFGFAMIDLNDLKGINDSYGHDKGDISIKTLSTIICRIFKHSPVYRIGGDEFIVILENDDYRNRETLIETFNSELSVLHDDEELPVWERVTAAIGCAVYEPGDTVEDVFKRADENMYRVKKKMHDNSIRNSEFGMRND